MSSNSGNNKLEFLSTHPSDATRIANLQKQIPMVKQQYGAYIKPATTTTTRTTKATTTKKSTSKKSSKKK